MAVTSGFVQQLAWSNGALSVFVGPSASSGTQLSITFVSTDSAQVRYFKRVMATGLSQAQQRGWPVAATHSGGSAEITGLALTGGNISPVGPIVHNDFLGVSGTGIPSNTQVVFESAAVVVTITPDLVRPHWVLISRLPLAISPGRNTVYLQAPGWTSDQVPVEVSLGPRATVRTLYSGPPKDAPYTVAFIGNPAIEAQAGGTFTADSVLTDRPGYHATVAYCMRNLLTVTEDVLRQADLDRSIRVISLFDNTLAPIAANSLASELNPNIMRPRFSQLRSFLSRFSASADIVFVIYSSTTHDRASAWWTTDDSALAGTSYTYDGASRTHGHYASTPGSAVIPTSVDVTGLTAIHEFGHASSDSNNGMVIDLYVDTLGSGFVVNKKARASATDPIPAAFATYNGTSFASDPSRDSLGYPGSSTPTPWTSYHPQLMDPTRPNLMDNYWLAFDDPQRCRLDRLLYAWVTDRLRAKISR
jgi:hypothetical protein